MAAPKRILIVEDQRLIAADLEQTLKRLGYEIVGSVSTGEEAVETALQQHPDLALMDIRLRGPMDGIEAANVIRQQSDMPVVYLTGYADEDTLRRAMITGPLGYILKPFNERELTAAIEIALYKRSAEQQLAEERARRAAAEEFRLLVDGALDYAIFSLDVAGRVTSWNTGAERITGYAPDEVIGQHWSLFHAAESIATGQPEALLSAAARDGQSSGEGWRVRKDATRFWAGSSVSALSTDKGVLRGFCVITHDMTGRRNVELALERSAARLSAVVAGALDSIISIDADGRIVEWNPAAEHGFGYTRDEAIGRELAELIIPLRFRRQLEQDLERFRATGESPVIGKRIELPAVRKDGSQVTIELNVVKLPSVDPPVFTAFIRDITERKASEHAQRLLDRATLALASSLDVGDVVARAVEIPLPDLAQGCFVDLVDDRGQLGQAASSHVEPERAELARRLGKELIWLTPRDRGPARVFATGVAEVYPEIERAPASALPSSEGQTERLRALGAASHISVPIRFRGTTQGVLTLLRSSGAEAFGRRDLALAQELARRIGIAIDNAKHYRQAQDAIRARDEFLQIASHELKTPLTPLALSLETLGRALQDTDTDSSAAQSRVDLCTRQVRRLNLLVEALLDVSRVTSGRFALELDRFDLTGSVRDVAERFRSEAKRVGSQLEVRAEHSIIGRWDRLRVEQIISNLLSNALRYGAGKPIEIDVSETRAAVQVTVSDHGIGIEPAALDRIFERFERAASMRHYGGLGLGLFISRQLAHAHGGNVSVDSRLGVGSSFTLTLPHEAREQVVTQ
jgi:PAS domain S-box-containing protein